MLHMGATWEGGGGGGGEDKKSRCQNKEEKSEGTELPISLKTILIAEFYLYPDPPPPTAVFPSNIKMKICGMGLHGLLQG
jgi:hypothetical protein